MRRVEALSFCFLSICLVLAIGCSGGSNGTPVLGNPTPALSSLNPVTATAGASALTLTASGGAFISTSQVEWNGAPLATTFVSSTSLTAQIPASDLATAATITVTVNTPAPGGGSSSALSFTVTPPPNPVPTLTSISPSSATAGSAAVTLTATGTNFITASQVLWNGTALTTTFVSSTSLTAQIPVSDLTTAGSATISVQNPSPGGGTSSTLPFSITSPASGVTILNVEGNDIAWDAAHQKIYVAVPSTATVNPGTVTVVDPIAGTIGAAVSPSSAPTGFALSADDSYLYATIAQGATIQRLTLPSLTPDIHWSLGTDANSGKPNVVGDIKVQPVGPSTVAVSFGPYGSGSIAIFDNAVQRPSGPSNFTYSTLGNALQWKADGTELYNSFTTGSDNGSVTDVSDVVLFAIPVTANGLGSATTYRDSFRNEGTHLPLDPTTGFVYGDYCEFVDPANGIPQGHCRQNQASGPRYSDPLTIVDSALKRIFYLVEVAEPDGTLAFQIQAIDSTTFQSLSTLYIPAGAGTPTNFIRWGQSGLAFVTNQTYSAGAQGNLYLLDGPFVNPSGPADSAIGTPIVPVPTLTSIAPVNATVGSTGTTLTVTGRDFGAQPTVFWNGTALPTSVLNSTQLSVQVPTAVLATATLATLTASNTSTASPGSNSLPFAVDPAPPTGNKLTRYNDGGNNVLWDASTAKLLVSEPGLQGDTGDAIGIIDPVAGTVTSSGFIGSDPAQLALSSDSQYLYAGLYGANSIEQLTLPSFRVNNSWNLGGADTFFGPYYALNIVASPTAPNTTAVVLANFDVSPSPAAVTLYDGPTPRSSPLQDTQYPYSSLQWTSDGSTLYAVDQEEPQGLFVLGATASGAVLDTAYPRILTTYGLGLHFDAGTSLVYTDGGQVIQPSSGTVTGTFGASGLVIPDSTLNRVFILGQTPAQFNTSTYSLQAFNQSTLALVSSLTISNVVGSPTSLVRWGTNGLAFTTRVGSPSDLLGTGPGQLYVLSGSFVNAADPTSQAESSPTQPRVQRTWGFKPAVKPRPALVVRPNPFAQ